MSGELDPTEAYRLAFARDDSRAGMTRRSVNELCDALDAARAGADATPVPENAQGTPGQLWHRLLTLGRDERLEVLGRMLDAAYAAGDCLLFGHEHRLQEVTAHRDALAAAVTRVQELLASEPVAVEPDDLRDALYGVASPSWLSEPAPHAVAYAPGTLRDGSYGRRAFCGPCSARAGDYVEDCAIGPALRVLNAGWSSVVVPDGDR